MLKTTLLNGITNERDKDYTALWNSLIDNGVITGLEITTNSISAGSCFVKINRTSITPNEEALVLVTLTASEVIDTSGTKKFWIVIDQNNINDPALNDENGTLAGRIESGASYPAGNYIPLADIVAGVISDEREFIKLKEAIENRGSLLSKGESVFWAGGYTFLGTERNNGLYIIDTTAGDVTIDLDPSLFDLSNGLYVFTFVKTVALNNLIIDAGGGNTIDATQTYNLVDEYETVTIKISTSTTANTVAFTNKTVTIDVGKAFYFWDGSDGDLVVLNGETVTLNGDLYQYNSIDIQAGGIVNRTVATPLKIKCLALCNIDGQIDLEGQGQTIDKFATSSSFNLAYGVWGNAGSWGYRSGFPSGATGTNPSSYVMGAGASGWGSSNTNYKGWAGWNSWFPGGNWGSAPTTWNGGGWGLSAWGWGGWNSSWTTGSGWDAYGNNWENRAGSNGWGGWWAGWGWGGALFLNWLTVQGAGAIDCNGQNGGNGGNGLSWTCGGWGGAGGWGGWAIWIIYGTYTYSWTVNVAGWSGWSDGQDFGSTISATSWGSWTAGSSSTLDYTLII